MAGLGPLNIWGPTWLDFQGPGKAVPGGWSSELPVSSRGPPHGCAPDQAESAQVSAHTHYLALPPPSYLVRDRTLGPPLENNPEIPPSSRAEGLRLLHGLEANLATSLQTPQEA